MGWGNILKTHQFLLGSSRGLCENSIQQKLRIFLREHGNLISCNSCKKKLHQIKQLITKYLCVCSYSFFISFFLLLYAFSANGSLLLLDVVYFLVATPILSIHHCSCLIKQSIFFSHPQTTSLTCDSNIILSHYEGLGLDLTSRTRLVLTQICFSLFWKSLVEGQVDTYHRSVVSWLCDGTKRKTNRTHKGKLMEKLEKFYRALIWLI